MDILTRAAELAGLDLEAVGRANFRKAIERIMRTRQVPGDRDYLELLARDPRERRLLAGEAVVQESWLFRDPEAYAGLVRLANSAAPPLRLLSVPCATGEEPASMAATLRSAGLAPDQFLVDAADAHPAALAQARTGRFGPGSLRGGTDPGPHFRPQGQDLVLDPALLQRIRFLEADVLDGSFLRGEAPYQAVFCRHLLIYLAPPARTRLAANLKRLLGDSGVLFTSPVEAAAFSALGLSPAMRPAMASASGISGGHGGLDVPACPVPAKPVQAPTAGVSPATTTASAAPGLLPAPAKAEAVPTGEAGPGPDSSGEEVRRLADQGRLGDALALAEAVIDREGPTACLYHLMGAVLLALGREEEAEQALRRAVYLDPGHVESLAHLELLHRSKGRLDEAGRLAARARRAGETRP